MKNVRERKFCSRRIRHILNGTFRFKNVSRLRRLFLVQIPRSELELRSEVRFKVQLTVNSVHPHKQDKNIQNVIPFRLINKLVTRRSASRGDLLLKNFGGVMLGGSVVVFLDALAVSQALIDP